MSPPRRPYEPVLDRLRDRVLEGPGRLDPAVRRKAFDGEAPMAATATYVEKVRDRAYQVTAADIHDLVASGLSEDEIFELTVATALGAGLRRLDAALETLEEGDR